MSEQARRMAQLTVDFINQAGDDDDLSERMGFAQTVVQITFQDDGDEESCTLYLDRAPIEAELGQGQQVEVHMWGSPSSFGQVITGKDHMAMAILRGDLKYKGPVRKFLRVVPIFAAFDFDAYRGEQKTLDAEGPIGDVTLSGGDDADDGVTRVGEEQPPGYSDDDDDTSDYGTRDYGDEHGNGSGTVREDQSSSWLRPN